MSSCCAPYLAGGAHKTHETLLLAGRTLLDYLLTKNQGTHSNCEWKDICPWKNEDLPFITKEDPTQQGPSLVVYTSGRYTLFQLGIAESSLEAKVRALLRESFIPILAGRVLLPFCTSRERSSRLQNGSETFLEVSTQPLYAETAGVIGGGSSP